MFRQVQQLFFTVLEQPKNHLRKMWICRFPIFFSFVLVLIGPLGLWASPTILGNGFLIGTWAQLAALTAMSTICATLLLMQITVMLKMSSARFDDVESRLQDDTKKEGVEDGVLRAIDIRQWRWGWIQTCFWLAGGFCFPVTCWLHSMKEAGGGFTDDPEMTFVSGLLGLILGLAAHYFIVQIAATIDNWVAPERSDSVFPIRAWASFSWSLEARYKAFKSLFCSEYFELVLAFAMLLGFYFGAYCYMRGGEMTPENIFTAPFYLILMLTISTMILAAMSFFLDYYRIPTFFGVFLVLLAYYLFSSFDHRFPVLKLVDIKPLEDIVEDSVPTASDVKVDNTTLEENQELRLIIVAPGGGIHASAWTGQVLSGLHDRYREGFASRLELISAVSGGAVGTMYYLDNFPYLRMADLSDSSEIKEVSRERFRTIKRTVFRRSSTSSLEALAWGATFPDTMRLLLGNWVQEDRGIVQERRWLRRMDIEGDDYGPTLMSWMEKAQKKELPYVVFNATEAETGRRILFSTFRFPFNSHYPAEAQAIDFLTIADGRFDLPISTAVRLSATFPYAASAAMPAADTIPLGHVVDGGYVDNEGLLTAVEYVRFRLEGTKNKVKYLIVRILHTPPLQPHMVGSTEKGFSGSGWEYASVGPLMAMSNVRITSQRERGEIELELLKSKYVDQVESVVLQFAPPDDYKAPPLNWKLSPKQRVAYGTAWDDLTSAADEIRFAKTKDMPTREAVDSSKPTKGPTEFQGLFRLDEQLKVPMK